MTPMPCSIFGLRQRGRALSFGVHFCGLHYVGFFLPPLAVCEFHVGDFFAHPRSILKRHHGNYVSFESERIVEGARGVATVVTCVHSPSQYMVVGLKIDQDCRYRKSQPLVWRSAGVCSRTGPSWIVRYDDPDALGASSGTHGAMERTGAYTRFSGVFSVRSCKISDELMQCLFDITRPATWRRRSSAGLYTVASGIRLFRRLTRESS